MLLGRIIEVADDQRHLAAYRGFLVVKSTAGKWKEMGRIPLDDVGALICNAHGLSYTNNLLVALAERTAPMVLCGQNHNAVGMLLSIDGNFRQAKRFDAQAAVSKPVQKQLWAQIVRAKLLMQALVLEAYGVPAAPLRMMMKRVRSGDAANLEAQGARYYWQQLFGDTFRRDRKEDGLNSLLNYGYTVLRAATARAIVAAGLHPTLGLHHQNENNAMRLVDDLMEPYRPLIDLRIRQLSNENVESVTPDAKRALVLSLYEDIESPVGRTPVMVALQRTALSLVRVYLREDKKLELPSTLYLPDTEDD